MKNKKLKVEKTDLKLKNKNYISNDGKVIHLDKYRQQLRPKRSIWRELITVLFIFLIGSAGYGLIEILFRGYTHWSMLLTGGACFLSLYYVYQAIFDWPITLKALVGAIIITAYELVVGLVVNIFFGMNVWDYSTYSYNFMGQICPQFTFLWFLLCFTMFGVVSVISKGLYYKDRFSRP